MEKIVTDNSFSFRSGEMKIVNGKVQPQPINGKVNIFINQDKLLCWQWISDDEKIKSEPLVIFSDEWDWSKVPTKKGRVYQLKSKCFDDVFLYWLQDPDTTKDDKLESHVKIILKSGKLTQGEEKANVSNTTTGNSNNTNNPSNSNSEFMSVLDNLLNKVQVKLPGLRRILSSKNIKENLMSKEFIQEAVKHLPEGQQSEVHYMKNISSPQFIQAIQSFSEALNSENYNVILSSFGLNISDAKNAKDGVEGLILSIIKKFPPKDKPSN